MAYLFLQWRWFVLGKLAGVNLFVLGFYARGFGLFSHIASSFFKVLLAFSKHKRGCRANGFLVNALLQKGEEQLRRFLSFFSDGMSGPLIDVPTSSQFSKRTVVLPRVHHREPQVSDPKLA